MPLERDSKVIVGAGAIGKLPSILKELGNSRAILIADRNVARLHADRIASLLKNKPVLIEIPSGERAKKLRNAEVLYHALLDHGATRRTPVIALGGGVTTDLVGFAASTYMRGLPLILVPTTLLAQADAAIGGKNGINLRAGKNLVGTFYFPDATLVDPEFLRTLPERELRNGFAEIIKMCILDGEKSFRQLEKFAGGKFSVEHSIFQSLLKRSIDLKVSIVKEDPRETTGKRAWLNLGHTFAHGLEAAAGYKRYTHGEAVTVGLIAACRLAESVTDFSPKLTDRIRSVILKFRLPVNYSKVHPEKVMALMTHDKKREKSLRFVLPKVLGKVELCANIPNQMVLSVLKGMRSE